MRVETILFINKLRDLTNINIVFLTLHSFILAKVYVSCKQEIEIKSIELQKRTDIQSDSTIASTYKIETCTRNKISGYTKHL